VVSVINELLYNTLRDYDAFKAGLLTWAFAHCKYLCFWKLAPSVHRCANENCLPVSDNIKQFMNNT